MPLRRQITRLDRGALRVEARSAFGLEPGRTTLLVTRRIARGPAAQRDLRRGRRGAGWRRASRCCTWPGGGKTVSARTAPGRRALRPAYVVRRVPRPDGPRLRRRGRCRLPGGRGHGLRADDGRACRRCTCRCPIGNGEQRLNADAGGRGRAGACSWTTPHCTPAWVRAELVPLLRDPVRLAAMAEAAARFGIRDGDERLADLVCPRPPRGGRATRQGRGTAVKPDLTLEVPPVDALAPVHFIAIGGVGMSGIARILLDRGMAVSGSDAKDSPAAGRRCVPSARRCGSATTPAHLDGVRHRRRVVRRPGDQPRARAGPRRRARGCCTGRRPWPR